MSNALPGRAPVQQQAGRLRLGFLGVGWIGRHRLQALVRSNLVEVVAIADPMPALAEQLTHIAPEAALLQSLDALLA